MKGRIGAKVKQRKKQKEATNEQNEQLIEN